MAASAITRRTVLSMTKLEKEIEQKLTDMVRAHGGLCLKWVCPGWSGVPDRIVLMPGGRVFFIELKRPKGGVVSPLQRWWNDKLRALGFWAGFIYDRADLAEFALALRSSGGGRR